MKQAEIIQDLALSKIARYNKPVKTKHLARSLGVTRPDLVQAMNHLKKEGVVRWHVPKRTDENTAYGWVFVRA